MASFSAVRTDVYDRHERREYYRANLLGLNAYDRHKKFMNDYVLYYGKERGFVVEKKVPLKTDQDTLKETYRFIRTEEDDAEISWEQRLAKRYYEKLFKEYCIADMSRYKDGQVGLRWRAEKEVISGKGQFACGNKSCDNKEELSSYEVNFAYKEAGEHKQAFVKLRLCMSCAKKLNYKRKKEKRNEASKQKKRPRSVSEKQQQFSRDGEETDGSEGDEYKVLDVEDADEARHGDAEYGKYFKGLFP